MPKSDYKHYCYSDQDYYYKHFGAGDLVTITLYFHENTCGFCVQIAGTSFMHESNFRERFEFEQLEKMTHGAVEQMLQDFCKSVLGANVSLVVY